jgi:hypothetical protein
MGAAEEGEGDELGALPSGGKNWNYTQLFMLPQNPKYQ